MKAIVAVDGNWGIGKDGKLLVHLPGDLKYFKEKTLGKTLVMGRETLETLPGGRPLPGRQTIVLSRNCDYETSCTLCTSIEELVEALKDKDSKDVFVAGGEKVYRQLLPLCDSCFVTKIEGTFPADRHFPNLDGDRDFEKVWESDFIEEGEARYKFIEYRRKG